MASRTDLPNQISTNPDYLLGFDHGQPVAVPFSDPNGANASFPSSVSGGGIAATAADVLADIAPADPGTWPALTVHYISTTGAGVDVGTKVVWIPTDHATLPAAHGWRFEFYPSATVV